MRDNSYLIGNQFAKGHAPNKTSFKKGHKTWNIGVKTGIIPKTAFKKGEHFSQTTEFKKKENRHWKGSVGAYNTLHAWINRNKGKAVKCEHCGFESSEPRKIHWANISHKYLRDLNDYISLCASCHFKYDN